MDQSISIGTEGDVVNVVFNDDQVSARGSPYSSITGKGINFEVLGSKFSADINISQRLKDVNKTPSNLNDDEKELLLSVSELDFSINDGDDVILAATSGQGKLLITTSGFVGSVRAAVEANVPGLALSGNFDVQFNTTGQSVVLDMNGYGNGSVSAGSFVQVRALGANLNIAGQVISGDVFFLKESQNDGSDLIRLALNNISASLGDGENDYLNLNDGSGSLIVSSLGVAGKFSASVSTSTGLDFALYASNFEVTVNTTGSVVSDSLIVGGAKVILNLEAGNYFRVIAESATLELAGQSLSSTVQFEQFNYEGNEGNTQRVRILIREASASFGDASSSFAQLNNGSGFSLLKGLRDI